MFDSLRHTVEQIGRLRLGSSSLTLNSDGNLLVDGASSRLVQTTEFGADNRMRFAVALDGIAAMNEECARAANLCSTRLGRAQQACRERSEALMELDALVRSTNDVERRVRELGRTIDKLARFCSQTELALTHLEAAAIVQRHEETEREEQRKRTSFSPSSFVTKSNQAIPATKAVGKPPEKLGDRVAMSELEVTTPWAGLPD